MSRTVFYHATEHHGFVEMHIGIPTGFFDQNPIGPLKPLRTIVSNSLPTMSCIAPYPLSPSGAPMIPLTNTSIKKNISGILWMLATMGIRAGKLDNAALIAPKVIELDDSGNELTDCPIRQAAPVIGLLPPSVLNYIMYFALGISHETVGYIKNTRSKLIPVSRQDHLSHYAFFLFSRKHLSCFILHDLIQAIKNDDRKFVAYIIEKNPTYLFLQSNDHVTALELAFRTDNTVLVKMIIDALKKLPNGKKIIAEQLQKIFPNGYDAHCKAQEREARQLFVDAGILDSNNNCILFHSVSSTDIMNVYHHVPNTDSALHQRLKKFNALLTEYYRTHLFHNDHILEWADKIYVDLFNTPLTSNKGVVLSENVISPIQQKEAITSLFRLKNQAQGIHYLVKQNKESPSDSFMLRDTSTDIRSLDDRFNVDHLCINIFGQLQCVRKAELSKTGHTPEPTIAWNLSQPKIKYFQELWTIFCSPRYLVSQPVESMPCLIKSKL